jgi:hypothetical protein
MGRRGNGLTGHLQVAHLEWLARSHAVFQAQNHSMTLLPLDDEALDSVD